MRNSVSLTIQPVQIRASSFEWTAEPRRAVDSDAARLRISEPVGFQGGDYNLYRYAGNNPLNATDPTGLATRMLGQAANAIQQFATGVTSAIVSAGTGLVSLGSSLNQGYNRLAASTSALATPPYAELVSSIQHTVGNHGSGFSDITSHPHYFDNGVVRGIATVPRFGPGGRVVGSMGIPPSGLPGLLDGPQQVNEEYAITTRAGGLAQASRNGRVRLDHASACAEIVDLWSPDFRRLARSSLDHLTMEHERRSGSLSTRSINNSWTREGDR